MLLQKMYGCSDNNIVVPKIVDVVFFYQGVVHYCNGVVQIVVIVVLKCAILFKKSYGSS